MMTKKIAALTRTLLERLWTFNTCIENRSFAALATAQTYLPDLILLDVDMPGKDGGDVAAELAQDPILRTVPIIFLTSLVSPSEVGFRNGAQYFSKPVNPQLLVQAVRKALLKAA